MNQDKSDNECFSLLYTEDYVLKTSKLVRHNDERKFILYV